MARLAVVNSRVVVARVVIDLRAVGIEQRRDGLDLEQARVFLERLRQAVAHNAVVAKPEMRSGVVRTEGQGALKFMFRDFEIPIVTERHIGEDGVTFAEQGVQLESVLGNRTGFRFGFERRHIVVRHLPKQSIRAGKTGVGKSVLRIFLDRLLVGFAVQREIVEGF
jgi:hypothetical protein